MARERSESADFDAKVAKNLLSTEFYADCGVSVPAEPRAPLTGERKLARTLVEDAVEESLSGPSRTRDDAREWLRDGLKLMSARTCFEACGIDYDAALQKLEAKWKAAE